MDSSKAIEEDGRTDDKARSFIKMRRHKREKDILKLTRNSFYRLSLSLGISLLLETKANSCGNRYSWRTSSGIMTPAVTGRGMASEGSGIGGEWSWRGVALEGSGNGG